MREIDEQLPNDMASLVVKITDQDHLVRRQVAERMGSLGDSAAAEPLMSLINDEHPEVRATAAFSLGRLGDPRALPAICDHVIHDPAPKARAMSVWAAGEFDSATVTIALQTALGDPDVDIRLAACWHFVHRRDGRALPQIRELLRHPGSHHRSSAASMLIHLGLADDQVFNVLERDESWHVRQDVAEELVRHKVVDPRVVAAIERLMTEPEAAEYEARLAEAEEEMAAVQSDDEPDEELTEEE